MIGNATGHIDKSITVKLQSGKEIKVRMDNNAFHPEIG